MDFRLRAELHHLKEHIKTLQRVATLMEQGDIEGAWEEIEDQAFAAGECRQTLAVVLGYDHDDRDPDHYWLPAEGGRLVWTGRGDMAEFHPE